MKPNARLRKRIDIVKFAPWFVLFAVMMVWHAPIRLIGDDLWFHEIGANQTMVEYVKQRYFEWSSRIPIEIVLIGLCSANTVIWKVLDSLAFTLIATQISCLFNEERSAEADWLIALTMLLFPYAVLKEAGYIATTLNYIWPILGLLFILRMIKKTSSGTRITILECLITIAALLFAAMMEQTCLVLIGYSSLTLLYMLVLRHQPTGIRYTVIITAAACLSLLYILTCPGNMNRTFLEMEKWFPEFAQFGFKTKVYIGVKEALAAPFQRFSAPFRRFDVFIPSVLFAMTLAVCSVNKLHNALLKGLAIVQAAFVVLGGVTRFDIGSRLTASKRFFDCLLSNSPQTHTATIRGMIVLVGVVFFTICMIELYYCFDKDKLMPVVFLGGVMSKFILGFSPTVYVSGDRTALMFYLSLMILMIRMLLDMLKSKHGRFWCVIVGLCGIGKMALAFL